MFIKESAIEKIISGRKIKEGLFSASWHNVGDRFAMEDLHRGAAAATMVGALSLDLCVLKL